MQVNQNYTGAQQAIAAQQRKEFDPLSMSGQTVEVERDGQAVTLTISDELKDLSGQIVRMSDLYTHDVDENDPFSYKPNDQWLIFSQHLYDEGVFDGKSQAEIRAMEHALQNITDGLDSLSRGGINFWGRIKDELDSHEAQLELGASVAALRLFAERYLSGETKNSFNQLIDRYKQHNEPIVGSHRSLEEQFYAARARINQPNANLSAERAEDLAITNAYGRQNFSADANAQQVERYRALFSSVREAGDLDAALQQAKQLLAEFALQHMNKNDQDQVRPWLDDRTQDTFTRIQSYFADLLEL